MTLITIGTEPTRAEEDRRQASIIAGKVRERRVRLGVSQQYLATVAGCSLGTIRTMEAGPPSIDMADRVDAALTQLEAEERPRT